MSTSARSVPAMSAVALAREIATGRITSVQATESALDHLAAVHETCNAVVSVEREAALDAARAFDALGASRRPSSPIAGVPVAHKDMFDRTGRIASWGANIRAAAPSARSATAIERLEAAGSLQVAALHMSEFAFSPTGHNYVIGHCRNPWDPARITGGSSSGSAAAVAAGAIPYALGSDTGGSLRLPAAACGIASIKPTYSRVSRAGAMPLSNGLDTIGALARHVEDLAAVLGVLAGHDPRDGATSRRAVPDYTALMQAPVAGLRIGFDEKIAANADPQIQRRLDQALRILEAAGCRRVAVRFPDWGRLDQLVQIVQMSEVAAAHAHFLRTRAADYGPQVRARFEPGHYLSAVDYLTALRARGHWLKKTLAETYAEADIAILPILPDPLPTIAELDVGDGPTLLSAMARTVHFTRPINYLGLPTLALAMPRAAAELPNGFQLIGRPFAEGRLLALGRAYQQAIPPEVAQRLA